MRLKCPGRQFLFKTICGFLSCDEGTVSVNGKVMGKDKDMLTEAGIIIEDPGFLRNWSAYHNLEFLYTIRNRPDKSYLHSVLNTVGLDSKLNARLENSRLVCGRGWHLPRLLWKIHQS